MATRTGLPVTGADDVTEEVRRAGEFPTGNDRVPLGSGVVTRKLGEGGVAAVFEVWNETLCVYRAVKLVKPDAGRHFRDFFAIEARIAAQLDDPGIVKILSVGQWRDLPFAEMERVDGPSLDKVLRKSPVLPPHAVTSVGMGICEALAHAHSAQVRIGSSVHAGVIHNDLKPGNVLISRSGRVKLTDFGIAEPRQAARARRDDDFFFGSLHYMAPEILRNQRPDDRADLFSMGCVLYEMTAGNPAFAPRDIKVLSRLRLENAYPPLPAPKRPSERRLHELITACLEATPEERPRTAHEVLTELRDIHERIATHEPTAVLSALILDGVQALAPMRRRRSLLRGLRPVVRSR